VFCAPRAAAAQTGDPRTQRPQAGDRFVFAGGERIGQVITLGDLPAGGPPLLVYPFDPSSRVVRDGSRLNQILLVRLAPDSLDEDTRTRSADGVVAYSGVCTHAGCDVTLWQAEARRFRCPCHESEFDPREGGRVVGGPAPRRLPRLPVKIVEGAIVAGGGFMGRPGFQPA
jgi:Rieske Fe-S protein